MEKPKESGEPRIQQVRRPVACIEVRDFRDLGRAGSCKVLPWMWILF